MILKHLGRSVDIFGFILMFSFWHILVSCIGLFHLLPFKYFYGAKCLIYINLCTFHVKENSARLQWYSCARYKAPGPLGKVELWPLMTAFDTKLGRMSGELIS